MSCWYTIYYFSLFLTAIYSNKIEVAWYWYKFHTHMWYYFLCLLFLYVFGMYFLIDVSTIHTLKYSLIAPWNTPKETGNIRSLCRSRTEIWSRYLCLFKMGPFNFKNIEAGAFGDLIPWRCFSIQFCNSLTKFSENCIVSIWTYPWINPKNLLFSHDMLFLRNMNSIIHFKYWTRE